MQKYSNLLECPQLHKQIALILIPKDLWIMLASRSRMRKSMDPRTGVVDVGASSRSWAASPQTSM